MSHPPPRQGRTRSRKAELGDVFEIWTPGEIQNYANLVANGFRTLAIDIQNNAGALNPTELASWNALYKDFINFYDGIGFFSRLSMATVRTAENYAKQLSFWRQQYTGKGKTPSGPNVLVPSDNNAKAFGTAKVIAVAAAVSLVSIATIYVVAKFKK